MTSPLNGKTTLVAFLSSILLLSLSVTGYLIAELRTDELDIQRGQIIDQENEAHLHAIDGRLDEIDRNGTRQLPELQHQIDDLKRGLTSCFDRLGRDEQELILLRQIEEGQTHPPNHAIR